MEISEDELATSLLTFAKIRLGFDLYDWQARAVEPLDDLLLEMVRVTLVTPNESGKSSVVIPTIVLGVLALYRHPKVVLTTADGKQLDGQVMPAIESHRHKMPPEWTFIEREIRTPTGGRFVAFTTDDPGRAEGWQPSGEDGPLVIIVDEAKTVKDDIFTAIDRCGYNALVLASSPGRMGGRFYESHHSSSGFIRVKAGLLDCPHISPEKIARIRADHGEASPFTRSALDGEFMEADGETRFDMDGLKFLRDMATAGHAQATRGMLQPQPWQRNGAPMQTWSDDPQGWVWLQETPVPGRRYIGFCDPMTGEQSEGSRNRDTHAAGIIRAAYADTHGKWHDAELVAALYAPSDEESSGAACRWDNDILAARFAMLLRHFGNCPAVVEANNAGTEVIRLLMLEGCNLWRREKPNHRIPGKQLEVVGFHTTAQTKNYWIGAVGAAIRDRTLDCRFLPAVKQCETFILNDKGTGEAQSGCHDDWVTGLGLGLLQIAAAQEMIGNALLPVQVWGGATVLPGAVGQTTQHGACA